MQHLKIVLSMFLANSFVFPAAAVVQQEAVPVSDKLRKIEQAATAGFAPAQYLLGMFRLEQASESVAVQEAMAWLEKAASQKHAPAAMALGEVFYYGDKLARDDQAAMRWFQQAAELGHAESMDYLGLVYYFGRDGVVRDCEKAGYWFDKGFRAGYTESLNNLVWLWATCPEQQYRNGKKAVEIGTMLLSNSPERDAGTLDTLAAAFAEVGDFDRAVQLQLEALSKLQELDQPSRYQNFSRRLEGYRAGKAWRGSSKEGGPGN